MEGVPRFYPLATLQRRCTKNFTSRNPAFLGCHYTGKPPLNFGGGGGAPPPLHHLGSNHPDTSQDTQTQRMQPKKRKGMAKTLLMQAGNRVSHSARSSTILGRQASFMYGSGSSNVQWITSSHPRTLYAKRSWPNDSARKQSAHWSQNAAFAAMAGNREKFMPAAPISRHSANRPTRA